MKKTILLLTILISFLCSCNQKEEREAAIREADSLQKVKIKNDSMMLSNIKIKKYIEIEDKSITILKPLTLTKRVTHNHDEGMYRYHDAERFQSFLTMRVLLTSKSKPNNVSTFFPNFNIFIINEKNEIIRLGDLDLKSYKKSNLNATFLEGIFDYVDRETFVAWAPVDIPIKGKLVISIAKGGDTLLYPEHIIGIINN